jgi:Leucine-rich repeat (LRR) protein
LIDGIIDEMTLNGVKKTIIHEYSSNINFQTILINTKNMTSITGLFSTGVTHELRFGDCPNLEEISFDHYNSNLTVLDIKKAGALKKIDCSMNRGYGFLTELNLSGCTALNGVYCSGNQLTELNLSGCTALKTLYCQNNQLTKLNLSGCTHLPEVECYNNQLTELNLSGCTYLWNVECYNPKMSIRMIRR